MPNNKKHHYVPRFYLKRFSLDKRSINLWNIKSEIKVLSSNLKHQCYKDYFYGKEPTVEKALGDIEGYASQIMQLIDNYEIPPPHTSGEHSMMVLYMLMQYGRTAHSVDTLEEMNDKLMKHLIRHKAEAKGIDLNKFTIGIKDSAKYSLGIVTQMYPLLLDLQCKLILNETDIDFVTSDNPVVMYNQLFSFRKYGGNTGLASKGLQIFFPISSRKLLIFYDHESYSVGTKSKLFIKVTSPSDIYELNTLQMVSAYENIYFENPNLEIKALVRKASLFRRLQKSNMMIFPGEETKNRKKELITTSREEVRTNLKLSFVGLTKSTKAWKIEFQKQKFQPAAIVRDKKLVDDHREFLEKVDNGEFTSGDFFNFMEQKYKKIDN